MSENIAVIMVLEKLLQEKLLTEEEMKLVIMEYSKELTEVVA